MTFVEITPHLSQPLWLTVYNALKVLGGLSLFYLLLIKKFFEFETVSLTLSSLRNEKETGLS